MMGTGKRWPRKSWKARRRWNAHYLRRRSKDTSQTYWATQITCLTSEPIRLPPRGYAENTTLVGPTTVEEVKTALFKMKTKGAAGPDTIWVPALRKFDRAGTTLTMLFRAYQ